MARLSHRLAAVWFADLVQFSRLAASNEEAALELVGHLQAAAREIAGQHDGRIVKFTGDGVLAEFTSAEAAVRAALSLRSLYRARSRMTAEGPGDLRIGVHLGELATASDGDVY